MFSFERLQMQKIAWNHKEMVFGSWFCVKIEFLVLK